MTYTKVYGIQKGYDKGKERYFVMCDDRRTALSYAKKAFALKKAYEFCQACHKDFVRFNGDEVHFIFEHKDY